MKTTDYVCRLAGDTPCRQLATVEIADAQGTHVRGCFRHADEALLSLVGARVVWGKTSVGEYARKALELAAH